MDVIKIRGARVHNLKNVDLDIPKNKLVVFTGVSGSGKSSLAFDTIYAEGQRRYVESLSSYARQFLGVMEKPDVDLIEGLSPAISIDQKTASHNPRSTVGTVTEIYDYLRLLYARAGHPHCYNCGREVKKLSPQEIVDLVMNRFVEIVKNGKGKPGRFLIMSPVVKDRKGEFKELFDNVRYKGYSRVRIDGYYYNLNDDDLFILKNNKHTIDIIIDRLTIDQATMKDEKRVADLRSRVFKAVENALILAEGLVVLAHVKDAGFDLPDSPKDLHEELYSERFSCPVCNISFAELEPRLFSFNSPVGACPHCKGLGIILKVNQDLVANHELSIAEGAIFPFQKILFYDTWTSRLFKVFIDKYAINPNRPLKELTTAQQTALMFGSPDVFTVKGKNKEGIMTSIHEKWAGVVGELEKKYYSTEVDYSRDDIEKYMKEEVCPTCKGQKLKPEALGVTVGDKNIADLCDLSILEEIKFFADITPLLTLTEQQIAKPIAKEISTRLHFLGNVGLGYLTLSRRAKTLSGGEAQRIRLASQIGTGLTGITYVLDEPSIGLHSRDVHRLLEALTKLRDLQNSVVVVEHDEDTIRAADWLVDFGPFAGKNGGEIVFSGLPTDITKEKKSITGAFLSGKRLIASRTNSRKPELTMTFNGATAHNLKNVSVTFPLNRMVGITGVSGSGKSSLLLETIYPALEKYLNPYYKGENPLIKSVSGLENVQRAVLVDQSPIGRTPRSNPATYTGVFTYIRDLFASTLDAKARGYSPGRFSFNVKGGRCENCQGAGVIKVEMQFLADVYITCDVCNGRRYNSETLDVLFKGKSIDQVIGMSVDDAFTFFENHHKIQKILRVMQDVGLGYIELGQPAPTLSGGEAQRVKLAKELYTNIHVHSVYILDEPTTGLHMYDVDKLIGVLRNLVEQGNTVLVIEHNLDVIRNCDYIVDLGPDGGDAGGKLLFQGTVSELMKDTRSYTAEYVRKYGHGEKKEVESRKSKV
ncbi:MAG: excinuclease ABC subunit UvrA [Patescibacteria group bacterium]|jgi:excinuclease ABC subunit A